MSADRWEIERAVTDAWTATTTDGLTFEARLARTLEEHAGSRTIRAQMIRDVAELALGRVAELQAQHAAELDALAQRHAGALEGQAFTHEARVARLEKDRDDWQQLCQSAQKRLDEKRTIRQELEQAAGADDCKVIIATDYHGWTVAGLEEIAYRLRTGGAGDDTPVDVRGSRAVAMVPAPNLVQLDASPKAKGGLADLQDQLPEPGPGRLHGRTLFALSAGVAFLIAFVLTVVFL